MAARRGGDGRSRHLDRKAQFASNPPHFDLGKSFDTFGPIGPVVVSMDDRRPTCVAWIVTAVNGEERQKTTPSRA